MLDLKKYNSVGEALRDALETWPTEVCLIESDRGEEKQRLTYRNFKDKALPLAKSLQDLGIAPGDRVHKVTSQAYQSCIFTLQVQRHGGNFETAPYPAPVIVGSPIIGTGKTRGPRGTKQRHRRPYDQRTEASFPNFCGH